MSGLLGVLASLALVNSLLMLPSGIAGVAAALGTQKPYLTASAFITGKFAPYFIFGLLLAIGFDAAFDQIGLRARAAWQDPTMLLIAVQFVIGAAMVVLACFISRRGQLRSRDESSTLAGPLAAFSIAAGMSLISLPGALMYFAAIDQILRADVTVPGVIKAILFYNVILLLPLMLLVLLRALVGERIDPLFGAVTRVFQRWGKGIILFGLLGVGTVLLVDAIGSIIGMPLLLNPVR
jgi:hypothetical protein